MKPFSLNINLSSSMLRYLSPLIAFCLCITNLHAQSHLELTLSQDTLLSVKSITYGVSILANYTYPEGVAPEDFEKMDASLRSKNTAYFEKFLASKKIRYRIEIGDPFNVTTKDVNLLNKQYLFSFEHLSELEALLTELQRLDFLEGGIMKVEYKNLDEYEHGLWTSLYRQARLKAEKRAKVANRRLGGLMESGDVQVTVETAAYEIGKTDSSTFGKLKMTIRFRFELL